MFIAKRKKKCYVCQTTWYPVAYQNWVTPSPDASRGDCATCVISGAYIYVYTYAIADMLANRCNRNINTSM